MNLKEIKAREQAAQNGDIGAIQTSQLDIKPLIAEMTAEEAAEMYGEAEETNEKLICRAEKAESEIATLKKALELMAKYIVEFGRVDYFLCDNIPQSLHLKYQPKNDGNYENKPCIECVQKYFIQQAQQLTHGEALESEAQSGNRVDKES